MKNMICLVVLVCISTSGYANEELMRLQKEMLNNEVIALKNKLNELEIENKRLKTECSKETKK